MDYLFTEEQEMIKELAAKIVKDKIIPAREELDRKGEFPKEILKSIAAADLFRIFIPEEYGGMSSKCLDLCIVVEELSKGCAGVAVSYAASSLGSFPIILYGSEEQKKKYLPLIASGEKLAAFAITEPNSGSDASATETTARLDGNEYILNGTKVFITNGGEADIYTVVVMTNKEKGARGASVFIVEKGTPGFSFGKEEDKMGIRCSATRELIFDNCRVPKENIICKEGMGFVIAMATFDHSRPGIGAQAVGIAAGALKEAVKYASERKQFGQPIISLQAIQHKLADMAMQVEAARALVYATARMLDSGKQKNFSKESAMAKAFPSDVAMRVTIEALQVFGGYGYMRDYPMEKYVRDAKITQIYEGTNEVQRNIIGLELIKESKRKKG